MPLCRVVVIHTFMPVPYPSTPAKLEELDMAGTGEMRGDAVLELAEWVWLPQP